MLAVFFLPSLASSNIFIGPGCCPSNIFAHYDPMMMQNGVQQLHSAARRMQAAYARAALPQQRHRGSSRCWSSNAIAAAPNIASLTASTGLQKELICLGKLGHEHHQQQQSRSVHHYAQRRSSVPSSPRQVAISTALSCPSSKRHASTATVSALPHAPTEPPLHAQAYEIRAFKRQRRRYRTLKVLGFLGVGAVIAYWADTPFRRFCIAITRVARVAQATLLCIGDYKILFRKQWDDPFVRHMDYKACHSTST